MPRNMMMDMMMARDGRRMRRMRDRGMGYGHYGVRGGEHYPMDGNYSNSQYADERNGRGYESSRQSDMGYNNVDMRNRRRNARGQYMADRGYEHEMPRYNDYGSFHEERGFRPIEAMGYFTGYYGGGEDYGRYDMRGRRDMNYDYGDYGETLTKEELEKWKHKLMQEVEEKDKHFFETANIEQKARQMGVQMKDYKAEELAVVSLMLYTDYCKTLKKYIGSNMDVYVDLAKDWLSDPDSEIKGAERLAVYHDEIIMGDDD